MIDAASIELRVRPVRLRARAPALEAERVAVATTALAVAMLPLLVPRGPANLGPADLFMAASIVSCLVWTASSGHRWRFVYAVPMALFLAAGALGALVGPVPNAGIVAILQDFFLRRLIAQSDRHPEQMSPFRRPVAAA